VDKVVLRHIRSRFPLSMSFRRGSRYSYHTWGEQNLNKNVRHVGSVRFWEGNVEIDLSEIVSENKNWIE